MTLLRNVHKSSKYLTYCTRAFMKDHPLTSPWSASVLQSLQLPSLCVPSELDSRHPVRWKTDMLSIDNTDLDKYGFSRDGDNEKNLSTLEELSIQEELENEIFSNSLNQVEKPKKNVKKGKLPLVHPAVIDDLQRKFGLTSAEALTILTFQKVYLPSDKAILQTIYCLKSFEIPKERLQRLPWLLLQSADNLAEKMKMLTNPYLFHNYFDGLGLSYFTKDEIRYYQEWFEVEKKSFPEHNNRIYYVADRLMLPVDQLTENLVKARNILKYDRFRIDSYIHLLHNYKIHPEDILSHLSIFCCNFDLAQQRLQELHEAGCKRHKLWLCHCTKDDFTRTVEIYKTRKAVLGECQSVEEYLMKRLQCSYEELKPHLASASRVLKVKVTRIQKMLDLLLSEGFTVDQIKYYLRILRLNPEKTAEKIKRLKDAGVTDINMNVLFKSNKDFDKYYDKLQKDPK